MYLSETHGTFWLDRRKFLLRKKQLGEKENGPTSVVLQHFSASSMFALHVKSRIDDMSMTPRDRSSIMPRECFTFSLPEFLSVPIKLATSLHSSLRMSPFLPSDHIPLFDVCSKYLSIHRLEFSLINIRRIVAKTVLACTRHIAVEKYVAIRTKALALTNGSELMEGDVKLAMSALISACHECNTNLCTVMSVIWHRLSPNGTEKTHMNIILALHLLKNLISYGVSISVPHCVRFTLCLMTQPKYVAFINAYAASDCDN